MFFHPRHNGGNDPDNQDDNRKGHAGALALADGGTEQAAQDSTDQRDADHDDDPNGGDVVTLRFKDTLDAQPKIRTGADCKRKERHRNITNDHAHDGFYHKSSLFWKSAMLSSENRQSYENRADHQPPHRSLKNGPIRQAQ